MTYQLVLCAKDGCVIASDRREYLERDFRLGENGSGAKINNLNKIRIDPTGRYAWAFAGGRAGRDAAGMMVRRLEEGPAERDFEFMRQLLCKCGDEAHENVGIQPNPSNPSPTVILVDGKTNKIIRAQISKPTTFEPMHGDFVDAGLTFSTASLFPQQFRQGMPLEQLATLAAYTIWLAGKLEPSLVEGLDIAIYRPVDGGFKFADSEEYLEKAAGVHEKVRACF